MKRLPSPPRIPSGQDYTFDALRKRNDFASQMTESDLSSLQRDEDVACYKGNVENIFGFIQIPLGLAGPLRLLGNYAQGDFLIPLATTEGSLVASYNRGMKAISRCGGASVKVTKNEIFSCAIFLTENPDAARALQDWIAANPSIVQQEAQATTKHGRYIRCECMQYGSRLVVNYVYDPADAMGINMITNASYAASKRISEKNGEIEFLLPAAFQGDKKATYYGFHHGRGRSVSAEVTLSAEVIETHLKSSADSMYRYYQNNIETAHLVGGYGFNMHIANGVTALGLATGQDPAYVGESANGHLIVEKQADGLLFTLNIPSLYLGTVGGGTSLPSHRPCLEMLGCTGKNAALKLAEIFAGTCLAGEISVIAAIASQQFVSAHNAFGRNKSIEAG